MPTYTTPESGKKQMVTPSSTEYTPVLTPGDTVTSWTDDDVIRFLIYEVLRLDKDKDGDNNEIENVIYRALTENGINSPKIWLKLTDRTIEGLQYIDKKRKINLVVGQHILIQQIRDFIQWKFSKLGYSNNIWRDNFIDHTDFDTFRCIKMGVKEPGDDEKEIHVKPAIKKQDPVSDFKKTIKRDKANYPTLEDDKMWLIFF